jgi:uncharacterized protein
VTPRAARPGITQVAGAADGEALALVRVTAAPTDGAANAAVVALLAKALDVAPRELVLVSGATSRLKRFEAPLDEPTVRERLARAGADGRPRTRLR